MSLEDCLLKAIRAKVLKPAQADRIRAALKETDDSEIKFLETFIQEKAEQRRRTHLQVIATSRAVKNVDSHPNGPGRGVQALITRDYQGKAGYSNVDYRRHALLAEYHSKFAGAMDAYRTKNLGFTQDTAGLKAMVKELFGESSGNPDAARFAKEWTDAAETARLRMNVAGGQIPKRQDWGLPHAHDARKIAGVSFDQWRDFTLPLLNPRRMFNADGTPMSKDQLDFLLTGLYEQFEVQAGKTVTDIDRSVPNKVDHRLLTFKDSESWLKYNERYGQPDIYSTMNIHLEHMAGDTALMEILGPNPDATMRQLTEKAVDGGAGAMQQKLIRDSYQVVTGRVNQTENEMLSNIGTTTRNLLSSAQLGSAFISSFSDMWSQKMTRSFNGLPAFRHFKEMFSLMSPSNAADRLAAVKMGLGAEAWITRALAASRFQEVTGQGLSAKVSDVVFRASLLSAWTDAGRKAFGMEFLGVLADNMRKGFDDLPDHLRAQMVRYGITPEHWKVIQQADVIQNKGARYLDLNSIPRLAGQERGGVEAFAEAAQVMAAAERVPGNRPAAVGVRLEEQGRKAQLSYDKIGLIRDASYKVREMILTETDFAVPTPDALVRAVATQGQKRGSLMGEVARSVALYKQFPVTMISGHLARGAMQLDGLDRGRYLIELALGLTVMGAISVQTRNLIKGKDPQDMTTPGFWGQAFIQGGGAGIFGDYIFSDVNRYGGGMIQTMAGPVGGLIDDATKLTLGNLHQYINGKDAEFAADLVRFGQRYTPGSNIWYARLALERLLWNRLQELADPDAPQSFRRIQQKARRDYGQEFWWKPGETEPTRAPNLEAVYGE